jgi:phosphomannomutase
LYKIHNSAFTIFKYVFAENGLVSFRDNNRFHEKKISDYLGEDKLKQLINFSLHYIADLDIPIKRGTFVEYRTGLINISPIGRNCSQQERLDFHAFNKDAKVLEAFKGTMEEKFGESLGLRFAIGGQISFDVFPEVN